MAHRTYRAIYSFVMKDATDVCIEEDDILIVLPLSNGEWQDPMSEMTGTNTRTNMTITFPGACVEFVSEGIAGSVDESENSTSSQLSDDGASEIPQRNEPESSPPSQQSKEALEIPQKKESDSSRTSQLFGEGFFSIPCSDTSTGTEDGNQHILSHQIPENVDIHQCVKLCMHAMKILKEYNGLKAGIGQSLLQMTLVEDVEVLNKLIQQCETETITIGVVGGYNSGKSTLINGLLNCKCLPEADKAETALPIPIQHNPGIHFGMCKSYPQSCCSQCPRLIVNGTEHIGQKNILSALSELNETTRFETPGTNSQLEVVLVANIPSLALESGYKIYLIDNPGLGELNQLATRLAELAVATSTAYIYTMDCENIELKEHAEVLKVLLERDHDLLQSGRLVMVVTKCDRFYERENALSGSKEQNRIKELVCKTFESSLQVPVPYDNVIPVSGKWQSWIARYETLDPRTRRKVDTSAEDYTELMDDCEKPKDKLAALKHGSNYAFLEEKITSLVQGCVDFFETKMKTGTLSALEWAMKHINSYKDALEKEINDRTENLRKIHQTFDEMKQSDQDIAKALDSDHVSRMEASLSAAFKIDIEQVREEMFKDAREKYTQFETVCKQKQRNGYIVREFLTDFKTFLLDMNSQVMLKIRKQQYRTMYELYFGVHKSLVNTFQELNKAASLVCHRDYEKTDIRDESTSCQEQLIVLSYDQISTLLVANQNIQRCNPQDTLNALICLRGLAALFRTRNSDGIFDDTAFPAISEEAVEEEAIFTHRLKSREVVSLLNVNKRIVEGELQSFLDAIESQFVGYFSNKFANHGKAYLRDCIANWKDHLTAARKDAESQTKEKVVLLKSLQKVSDLSDCIQSLIQNISTHL